MAVADVPRESRSPQRRLLFDGVSAVLLLGNWKQFPFPVEWACQSATWHCLSICVSMHSVTHYSSSAVAVAQPRVRLSRPLLDRLSCSLQYDEPILSRLYRTVKGKGSPYQVVLYTMMLVYRTNCPYSTAERRVPELIPVLGSQPAGDVSHKPGSRLPLLSAMPAITLATLRMAATSFAAW